MNWKNKYLWICIIILIILILFMQISIKIINRELYEIVNSPYEYKDSSTGKSWNTTADLPKTVQNFTEFYFSFDNPIDKVFSFFSCKGYQRINIGRFVVHRFEAEKEPAHKVQSFDDTGYRCYGPKKQLLSSKSIRPLQDQYYYRCLGVVVSEKRNCIIM
ncbi:MAG: hypothetical protein Q8N99_07560 [Nanoarchaeota archaeon]|nr:hypothetical protein [Nanoarchaeota archaeon]